MRIQTLLLKEKNQLKKMTKKSLIVEGVNEQKIKFPLLKKEKQVKIKIKRSKNLGNLQAVVVDPQGNLLYCISV